MERGPRQIYQDLKKTANDADPNKVQDLTSQMNQTFQRMLELVDQHQQRKMDNLEQFRSKLEGTMGAYWQGPFTTQMEYLSQLQERNRQGWIEIETRMEALNQIKNIYRQSFGNSRRHL